MITIDINDGEVDQALQGFQGLLDDLSLVMADIGQQLVRSAKDRIEAGTTVDGTPFAPRSPATLAAYARRDKPPVGGPLRLTDTMRKTLHHSYGPDFVSVASGAIQSAVMQFGADAGALGTTKTRKQPIPFGRIPARPFLGVSEADRADLIAIISEAILDAMA